MTLTPTSARGGGLGAVVVSGTPSAGQVVTASSATAASWTTPSTGSMTLLSSVLLASNTTISFASISQAYRSLFMTGTIQANDAGVAAKRRAGIQFNGDTAANYSWMNFEGASNVTGSTPTSGASSATIGNVAANGDTAAQFSGFDLFIPNYTNGLNKQVIARAIVLYGATTAWETQLVASVWVATAAITDILFLQSGGTNFTSGSRVDLYGIL